jgi:DNA-directed RNA polymerase subunit M/transcription elongation factor TFIIS
MQKTAPAPRTARQPATELSGPASLVNSAARSLAKCRICGSERVTSIAMTLTDGSLVHFASCHQCENRWWLEGESQLTFEHVIAKTRKTA